MGCALSDQGYQVGKKILEKILFKPILQMRKRGPERVVAFKNNKSGD
jgi:hypothetical protein